MTYVEGEIGAPVWDLFVKCYSGKGINDQRVTCQFMYSEDYKSDYSVGRNAFRWCEKHVVVTKYVYNNCPEYKH